MAQQDEHLTTEQLSAFLDKQLSPAEQAVFDAHVASCQQCQSRLADLRLAVALVRALPQEEVPRSFVLPSRLAPVAESPTRRAATVTPIPQQRGRVSVLQRTIRTVSTLAAVLALIFILAGIVPSIQFGNGGATSTAGSAAVPRSSTSGTSAAPVGRSTPATAFGNAHEPNSTKTPHPTPTPSSAVKAQSNTGSRTPPTVQPPALPPFLDLSQPEGRLALGALLLVLAIIGLLVTRRRRGTVY